LVFKEEGSFRDPAGQVILDKGIYIRQISPGYLNDYKYLMHSGIYERLVSEGLLISHTEKDDNIIVPEQLWFVSYPYEWSFHYLKQAAINTLKINRIALDYNMILKDASAYNMQRHNGKMMLVDTLSFAPYIEGVAWRPYLQFCQHFLYPLLLMKHRDTALGKLSMLNIDGVPGELVKKILPWWLIFSPSVFMNLYLHHLMPKSDKDNNPFISRRALIATLDLLQRLVESLNYKPKRGWNQYESMCSYMNVSRRDKAMQVVQILARGKAGTLCDLGANTGEYSVMASQMGYQVVAIDADHDCVDHIASLHADILALNVDLSNPSPAIGWGNRERRGLLERLQVDTILALALIHHLCIGNNVPLANVAKLLAAHCQQLVIEFVPPDDPKAKLLGRNRVYPAYSQLIFEEEFGKYFSLMAVERIKDSCRSIYLYQKS